MGVPTMQSRDSLFYKLKRNDVRGGWRNDSCMELQGCVGEEVILTAKWALGNFVIEIFSLL